MPNKRSQSSDQAMVYQIRIEGHLGAQWAEWFGGMKMMREENGDTLLTGPVVDQAALYGLLKKVRDLGMPLLSVNPVGPSTTLGTGQADVPDIRTANMPPDGAPSRVKT